MYSRDLVVPHPSGNECRYRVAIEPRNALAHSWLGDLSADEPAALEQLTTVIVRLAEDLLETNPTRNAAHRQLVLDTLLRRPLATPPTWTTGSTSVRPGLPSLRETIDQLLLVAQSPFYTGNHAALLPDPTDPPEERATIEHGV